MKFRDAAGKCFTIEVCVHGMHRRARDFWAPGTSQGSAQSTTKLAPGRPPGQFSVLPQDPLTREASPL